MEMRRNQQQEQVMRVREHGSVGGTVGVVVVIAVMGIVAVLIGRLCSGRRVMGYGPHMDAESWVESNCSACVDGNLTPPRYPRPIHLQALPIQQHQQHQQQQQQQQHQQQRHQQQQQPDIVERSESPLHHPQHPHQQSQQHSPVVGS